MSARGYPKGNEWNNEKDDPQKDEKE